MNDSVGDRFDSDELLHPLNAFGQPSEVINDPGLTVNEKRAILTSWASDVCAIEAAPGPRASPRRSAVRFEDITDALRTLDRQANGRSYRPLARRRRIHARRWRDRESNTGTPMH